FGEVCLRGPEVCADLFRTGVRARWRADGRLDLQQFQDTGADEQPVANAAAPLDTPFASADTPTEEVLTQIWMDVLGLDRVGTRDNFFKVGGHSLLATRVMAQVRESFAVE